MSITLDLFCLDFSFTIRFSAVLSVATDIGGCGWTISDRVVRMDIDFWKFQTIFPILLQWMMP